MKIQKPVNQISKLFKVLSQPARIEILLAIGSEEACVCHLEAMLKMRQAYISQHLMALRQAGILDTRRDGRFIFYSLANPSLIDLIRQAAETVGVPVEKVVFSAGALPRTSCACPKCESVSMNNLINLSL